MALVVIAVEDMAAVDLVGVVAVLVAADPREDGKHEHEPTNETSLVLWPSGRKILF